MQVRAYDVGNIELGELLRRAGAGSDATLLIPDLQRPYVWKPGQVVSLVDSLFHGWPFGTLLLWDVGTIEAGADGRLIPSRPFWFNVDRTPDKKEAKDCARRGSGATFEMVLDGQQRVQSLLLALNGDLAGFRLTDHEWIESEGERRARSNTKRYWSWGQLCLDLDAFLEAFEAANHEIMRVDYAQRVLGWQMCSANDAHSEGRPADYQAPLEPRKPGRHVRLSRFWELAVPAFRSNYRPKLERLLSENGVDAARTDRLLSPLNDLVDLMGALKQTQVAYLKIRGVPPDASEAERTAYDEGVVNIFTRLNKGGKPLTDQEVIFAWVKRKWDRSITGARDADECFEALRETLAERNIPLDLDTLVRGVIPVWAAIERGGKMLTEAEIRQGYELARMAAWLAERWTWVPEKILDVAEGLRAQGLEYRRHFESVNELITVWTWRLLAEARLMQSQATFVEREALAREVRETCDALGARWLLMSAWARRQDDRPSLAKQVEDLGKLWSEMVALPDAAAIAHWRGLMDGWLDASKASAIRFIDEVQAHSRGAVRRYHGLLWAWHRLDPDRVKHAGLVLKLTTKEKTEIDVDHVVSYDYWKSKLAPGLGPDVDLDSLSDGPNALGNCLLLEKNFNISKSAKPLSVLLDSVHEFKKAPQVRETWEDAMALEDELLDARDFSVEQIRAATAARTRLIKDALKAFVQGDVKLEDPAEERPTIRSWTGTWEYALSEKNDPDSHGLLTLLQTGEVITGEYGPGTKIEGEIVADHIEGKWTEPGRAGGFRWWLDQGGHAFTGTWGNGSHKRGTGKTWTGARKG